MKTNANSLVLFLSSYPLSIHFLLAAQTQADSGNLGKRWRLKEGEPFSLVILLEFKVFCVLLALYFFCLTQLLSLPSCHDAFTTIELVSKYKYLSGGVGFLLQIPSDYERCKDCIRGLEKHGRRGKGKVGQTGKRR